MSTSQLALPARSIEVFTAPDCSCCQRAKSLLRDRGLTYAERDIADPRHKAELLARLTRARSIPQIFVAGAHVGGYDDLCLYLASDGLDAAAAGFGPKHAPPTHHHKDAR